MLSKRPSDWLLVVVFMFLYLSALLVLLQMHIPGHAGYRGNEEADRLSREGAAKPLQPEHKEKDEHL